MSYGNIGGLHHERGEYQKALEYHEKSLKLSKEIGNRRSEGHNLLCIGKAYYRLGQFKRATEYTERALEILSEIGDRRNEGGVHGDLGHLYRDQGNYEKAKQHFGQALEIFEEIGDLMGKATCYNNIGILNVSLGDHEKTLEYVNKAIDIFKANGSNIGLGKAYSTIGGVYKSAGKCMKSREYYEEALKLCRESGDRNGEALATHGLGSIHFFLGEYNKAIAYAKKALAITQGIGERKLQISDSFLLGCAYLAQGHNETSYLYLRKALEIIKEIGIRDQELFVAVIKALGLVSASEGDYSKACDFLLEGVSNHQYTRRLLKDDSDKLSLDSSNFSCYNILSWFLVAQRKVKEALFVLELGRSRALVDLISKKYGMHRATTINEARLDTLQSLFQNQKSNVLFIAVLQGIVALWFVDRSGNIQFKKGKKIDVGEATFGVDVFVLEDQGAQCEDRSLSALYDDDLDKVEQSKKPQHLSTRKEDQSNRNIKSSCHYAHLYNDLIAPIIDLVEGPEIIIAPEGRLFMEPFAAFQDENGEYLTEKVRIRLVPSLTTLKVIQDSPGDYHRQTGKLVVGDPKVGAVEFSGKILELCPLPKAREEAQMVSGLLRTACLVGEQATKEEVLRRIQEVSLVHIAAHADAERGEIALAPNSSATGIPKKEDFMLTVKDIAEVGIRAKLVVLSCCHTARGKILTAEGVVGIARAFLGSGARSVLMSLWAVDDEATKVLMQIFYKCLIHEKMSASEALHQATKTMRESTLYKEVKYWAPFVLLGDDVTFDFQK